MGKVAQARETKGRGVLLTEGVIWKQLLRFAFPLLLSNFLQQLYNTADLLIVGRFAGETALAAVGATGSLTNLLVGFFIGLSTGASVVISQYYGSGNTRNLRDSIQSGVLISIIGGTILSVLGYFLSRPLLQFMGTPADILDEAVIYMQVIFLGMLPLLVYNMGAGILRAMGDSRRPLYLLILSSIINIVLDILFILPMGMGVAGAAWATVIAQIIVGFIVVLMLRKLDGGYHLSLRELRFHPQSLKSILVIGLPAGLQSAAINFSNVVIQSNINSFGSAAVGGAAAGGRIDGFLYMFANAFGLSAMTFVGQNVGAGKFERAKRSARVTLLISSSIIILLGSTFAFFSGSILRLFNNNPDVIGFGQLMVGTLAPMYWVYGITEVLSGVLRGAGMSVQPMLITIICFTAVRLLWINIMLPIRNDIWIVFLSWPVSWTIGAIASIILVWKSNWLKKTQEAFAARRAEQSALDPAEIVVREEVSSSVLTYKSPLDLPLEDRHHVPVGELIEIFRINLHPHLAPVDREYHDEDLVFVREFAAYREALEHVRDLAGGDELDFVAELSYEDSRPILAPKFDFSGITHAKESYIVRNEEGDPILYTDEASYLAPGLIETFRQSYEQKRRALEELALEESNLEASNEIKTPEDSVESVKPVSENDDNTKNVDEL